MKDEYKATVAEKLREVVRVMGRKGVAASDQALENLKVKIKELES